MEFYIAIDGEKRGPLTQFRVAEMLRSGEISTGHLGWHRGMESWLPLREIPALETICNEYRRADDPSNEAQSGDGETPPFDSPETGTDESGKVHAPGREDDRPLAAGPSGEEEGGLLPDPSGAAAVSSIPRLPVAPSVRPFTRFWARTFDYMLVTALVWLVSDVEPPVADPDLTLGDLLTRYSETFQQPEWLELAKLQFFALLGWHVLEGIALHVFGTTPGKALFGIQVRARDGRHPPIGASLGRSFFVYVLGVGLYQIPFSLIAMTFGFFRLLSTGRCLWDQQLKLEVTHPPMGPARILVAVGAFFALLLLQSLKFS